MGDPEWREQDKGDLVEYWPEQGNYAANQNFIIGLILFLEAKNNGVDIKEKSKTLSIGESVDPLFTPSLSNYNISDITTDVNPNRNLYQYSLDKALLEQKPIFITFSTPGLCVTGTCSPQLEELKKISTNYN